MFSVVFSNKTERFLKKLDKHIVSRIIDRLEGKGFVERKRRGMTNVVVMKE